MALREFFINIFSHLFNSFNNQGIYKYEKSNKKSKSHNQNTIFVRLKPFYLCLFLLFFLAFFAISPLAYSMLYLDNLSDIANQNNEDIAFINKVFYINSSIKIIQRGVKKNLDFFCYNTTFISLSGNLSDPNNIAFDLSNVYDVIFSGCKFKGFYAPFKLKQSSVILFDNIFENNRYLAVVNDLSWSYSNIIYYDNYLINTTKDIEVLDDSPDYDLIFFDVSPGTFMKPEKYGIIKEVYDYYHSQTNSIYFVDIDFKPTENHPALLQGLDMKYRPVAFYYNPNYNKTNALIFVVNNGSLYYSFIDLYSLYLNHINHTQYNRNNTMPNYIFINHDTINQPFTYLNISIITNQTINSLDFVKIGPRYFLAVVLHSNDVLFLDIGYGIKRKDIFSNIIPCAFIKDWFLIPSMFITRFDNYLTSHNPFITFVNYDFDGDGMQELIIAPYNPIVDSEDRYYYGESSKRANILVLDYINNTVIIGYLPSRNKIKNVAIAKQNNQTFMMFGIASSMPRKHYDYAFGFIYYLINKTVFSSFFNTTYSDYLSDGNHTWRDDDCGYLTKPIFSNLTLDIGYRFSPLLLNNYVFANNRFFHCDTGSNDTKLDIKLNASVSCHNIELDNEVYFQDYFSTYFFDFNYSTGRSSSDKISSIYGAIYPENINGIFYLMKAPYFIYERGVTKYKPLYNMLKVFIYNDTAIPLANLFLNNPLKAYTNKDHYFVCDNLERETNRFVYNYYSQNILYDLFDEPIKLLIITYTSNISKTPFSFTHNHPPSLVNNMTFNSFALVFDDMFFYYLDNVSNGLFSEMIESPKGESLEFGYSNPLIKLNNISIVQSFCARFSDPQGDDDISYATYMLYTEHYVVASYGKLNKTKINNKIYYCSSVNITPLTSINLVCVKATDKEGHTSAPLCKKFLLYYPDEFMAKYFDLGILIFSMNFSRESNTYDIITRTPEPIGFSIKLPDVIPFVGGEHSLWFDVKGKIIYDPLNGLVEVNAPFYLDVDILGISLLISSNQLYNLSFIDHFKLNDMVINFDTLLPIKRWGNTFDLAIFIGTVNLIFNIMLKGDLVLKGGGLDKVNLSLGGLGEGDFIAMVKEIIVPSYIHGKGKAGISLTGTVKEHPTSYTPYLPLSYFYESNNIRAKIKQTPFLSVSADFWWLIDLNLCLMFIDKFSFSRNGSYTLPITSHTPLKIFSDSSPDSYNPYNSNNITSKQGELKLNISNFDTESFNILPNKYLYDPYNKNLLVVYYDPYLNEVRFRTYKLNITDANAITILEDRPIITEQVIMKLLNKTNKTSHFRQEYVISSFDFVPLNNSAILIAGTILSYSLNLSYINDSLRDFMHNNLSQLSQNNQSSPEPPEQQALNYLIEHLSDYLKTRTHLFVISYDTITKQMQFREVLPLSTAASYLNIIRTNTTYMLSFLFDREGKLNAKSYDIGLLSVSLKNNQSFNTSLLEYYKSFGVLKESEYVLEKRWLPKLYSFHDNIYLTSLSRTNNTSYLNIYKINNNNNNINKEETNFSIFIEPFKRITITNESYVQDYDCLFEHAFNFTSLPNMPNIVCAFSLNSFNESVIKIMVPDTNLYKSIYSIDLNFNYSSFNDNIKFLSYNNNGLIQMFVRHYDGTDRLLFITLNLNFSLPEPHYLNFSINNLSNFSTLHSYPLIIKILDKPGHNIDDKLIEINGSVLALQIYGNKPYVSLNQNLTNTNLHLFSQNITLIPYDPKQTSFYFSFYDNKSNNKTANTNDTNTTNTNNTSFYNNSNNNTSTTTNANFYNNQSQNLEQYTSSTNSINQNINQNEQKNTEKPKTTYQHKTHKKVKRVTLSQIRQIVPLDDVINANENLLFFVSLSSYKKQPQVKLWLRCNSSVLYPDIILPRYSNKVYDNYYLSYIFGFSNNLTRYYNLSICSINLEKLNPYYSITLPLE